ncbi:MAG: hypothetical protein WAL55_05235 [Candidatus Acidiferrales bacterium]
MTDGTSYHDLNRFEGFPRDYSYPKSFPAFVGAFLAPIYFDSAMSLSQEYSIPFTQAWAWESYRLMNNLKVREEYGEAQRFAHQLHDWTIPGASFQLSEIYRSAFMRTLAWFYQLGKIPALDYVTHSLRICPVDLSLWELKTRDIPNWWPKPLVSSEPESRTVSVVNMESIKDLTDVRTDTFGTRSGILLAAEGPLLAEQQSNVSAHFALVGFAYRVHGGNLPHAEEVAEAVQWQSNWYANPRGPSSLKVLQGAQSRELVCVEDHWATDDLEIVPVVSRFASTPINLWQWFRGADRPLGLSSFLHRSDIDLHLDEDALAYEHKGGKVATAYDWRLGTLEHHPEFEYTCHGQAVEAKADWLQAILTEDNLRLAYILRTKIKVREQTYSKAKVYVSTELLNLTKVITRPTD